MQNEEVDEEEAAPPVPPGMGKLSAALRAFVDFLRIDHDLIATAAERSAELEVQAPREEMQRWIEALPDREKNWLLLQIVTGEASHPRAALLRRFRETRNTAYPEVAESQTVENLLAGAADRAGRRRRKEAEVAAKERARRERAAEEAHERRLNALAEREEEAWAEVEALIGERKPARYDEAVGILSDLRALGSRDGNVAAVDGRIERLRERHARKPTFVERLQRAGLVGPEG